MSTISTKGLPPPLSRRHMLAGGLSLTILAAARLSHAFGQEGAFNPRILLTGKATWKGLRKGAPARWSKEVVRRTSAPARLSPSIVRADSPRLLAEPFVVWAGSKRVRPLTAAEVRGLRRYLGLGGVMLVDDGDPISGAFGKSARAEIARVLPAGSAIAIGKENVVFRSFYLLERATGRLEHKPKLDAIVRGGQLQVLFSDNDLLGALAQGAGSVDMFDLVPGGKRQREMAVRVAVNIAMYVLCSNYKDDQVHAPFLMRRRANEKE